MFLVPLIFTNWLLDVKSCVKVIKLCDFKFKLCDKIVSFQMDLIRWQLNFMSHNFGLKLYLQFQFELVLHATCTCRF